MSTEKTLAIEDLKVYPNPANDHIKIGTSFKLGETAIFTLYDVLGNEVNQIKIEGGLAIHTLNVASLARGVYHYKAVSNFNKVFTGKLILN
jgi:hypothetical protein